uniref:Zona pellucida binding protein n=1 Tax=Anolis carolinensis TaxID=28377 RepID=G1KHI3_ANOCA|nr:PREDICTED: zona pellucida-binding protein 1 isoform X1 [Anolis carolinensis]|eukprot:XP_003222344.1 PREDICTED: zona pellucida-binding protein 1 isoform X1 [Anolis carolinensis]
MGSEGNSGALQSLRGNVLLRFIPLCSLGFAIVTGGLESAGRGLCPVRGIRGEAGSEGGGRGSRPGGVCGRVGMWCRGRERHAGSSRALCGPALLLVLVFQGLPSVYSSIHQDPNGLKVVGSTNLPVKVYVRLNHNSPRILCVTNRLRNLEMIDPIFQWHGPGGHLVTENSSVKITPTGTLLFRNFKHEMSGVYTCSLVFKPTTEQEGKSYLMKYIIYAFSDPSFYYEFTVRYHSTSCNNIHNISFGKNLLRGLSKLVSELTCEVSLRKSECHHVKMQRGGMQNEIFFTFTVSSLDAEKSKSACQNTLCDVSRRLRKAKDLIEHYFSQQVEVIGKRKGLLPETYYIEGTLQLVWVKHCLPGYGINALLHPDCPNCCGR